MITGFPTKLFVTLLGVMFLFSIAQQNRTLELLARKIVNMAGEPDESDPHYRVYFLHDTGGRGTGHGTSYEPDGGIYLLAGG